MANSVVPRPFLKWAGGKTQLLDDLTAYLPRYFLTYHEPFVGGGALFFYLYRERKIRRAFIADLNAELIDTYIAIRDYVEDVIELLSEYSYDEKFYYNLRAQDPWKMPLPARAARMIYLNKTGYNGLYRVNKQGKFNVPFGRHKSPQYCDVENLRAVSVALQDVEIACASFETVLEHVKPGDLVYFDPPYAPMSSTANFTAYHADGFAEDDQIKLRDVCLELTRLGVNVMLSNSDVELIQALYDTDSCFNINRVHASRAINSNAKKRGKLTELIITNYPAEKIAQPRLLEAQVQFTTQSSQDRKAR